jgi:peroxiredoxin
MGRNEKRRARAMKAGTGRNISAWMFLAAVLSFSSPVMFVTARVSAAEHSHDSQTPSPAIGAPAIDFDLKALDGRSVNLKSLRGKPVVLNFFASWCDPCRDEMPLINKLAAGGSGGRYAVLGIAVEDTRTALMQFVNEAGISFPVALDLDSTVKRSYRIFGPPATFFIDRSGLIRDVVLGPMTPERAHQALKKAAGS